MTAFSLKTKKVKNQRSHVGHRSQNKSQLGFTKSESRGIFGAYYKYTEEEQDRIKKYQRDKCHFSNSKHPTKCSYFEFSQQTPKSKEERKRQELEEKRDELSRLGLQLVGFNDGNGRVTRLER